ncbi:hypothetical protein SAMN05444745_1641 [Arthrobacter sp. OV608]|nr:hypothetical protein SAMN05444745_1641 [Arthrobacter sp. OV608]
MSSIQPGTGPRALERAYRGRSRCCYHPLQPARLPRHLHRHHCRPAAGHHRNRLAAGLPKLRSHRIPAEGTTLPAAPGSSCGRAGGGALVQVALVLRGTGCDRLSFFESTPQVPRRARSTSRLRDQLVDAVIRSGRAVSETALGFAVSWWMVRGAVTEAYLLKLLDVNQLSPRMLGIDEHRFRSVRYFQDPGTKTWTRFEPWMTTIVDLDTGQVLGVVEGGGTTRASGTGYSPGPWSGGWPCRSSRRPLRGIQKSLADVAAPHRGRSRSLPPDLPGQSSPSTIQPAPSRRSGRSKNSSGHCSAPAPWKTP